MEGNETENWDWPDQSKIMMEETGLKMGLTSWLFNILWQNMHNNNNYYYCCCLYLLPRTRMLQGVKWSVLVSTFIYTPIRKWLGCHNLVTRLWQPCQHWQGCDYLVDRLSLPCDKVVTTMSAIDKVVTTLWIGCHVKLRLSSLCYNLVCRLSQVSVTRSQP